MFRFAGKQVSCRQSPFKYYAEEQHANISPNQTCGWCLLVINFYPNGKCRISRNQPRPLTNPNVRKISTNLNRIITHQRGSRFTYFSNCLEACGQPEVYRNHIFPFGLIGDRQIAKYLERVDEIKRWILEDFEEWYRVWKISGIPCYVPAQLLLVSDWMSIRWSIPR